MQFQILGPLRVTDREGREIALGGAKPAAVLAMLLLRPNELVPADRLIEDLWDGQPPATAAKTLQVHISRLRRAFGQGGNGDGDGPIVTGRGGYVLEVAPDAIDAHRFQTLVSEGRAALPEGAHRRASARLREALALWRGEALADFAYASFAQDTIARLDGLRTVALESALEAELALGRHAELVPELKSLVKRHPLSEHLRCQLMLALYRAGRQAEALGVYRAGRRILVDQLGLEPGAELRELERAILAHDAAVAAPAPKPHPQQARAEKSSRGVLVGYERELGGLEELLEQALAGQGRLALISGEPGVGKTRLADELSSVAHARGAQVLWGRCWTGGGAPAYWPWIQVLRALIADRDPLTVRAELGASVSELTQLLPELKEIVADTTVAMAGDAEGARFRLFDAAASFLVRAAGARPVVIVLDDLQAADHSTLALLQFMAAAALDAPVLIVGTYRDSAVALEPRLSETLSELARTSDCLQLVLTGLSTDDTAHFVELSAGVAPMPMLASAIHDASSGNPLFVSELVRLLQAEGRLHELDRNADLVLPRGVEQVIARRLEHLSEPCRRTLSLAAVIGREFDVNLLARAGGTSADELLGQLEDALAARVLETSPGAGRGMRFSHDLIRHTLYAGLGAVDRRRMHEAVARALEDLHASRPEPVVADLAYHFGATLPGGDAAKASRYSEMAGDQAAELSAFDEAASHYSRAAETGKAHGADADVLCELYLKLAEQLVLIPELEGAGAAIEEAEGFAGPVPDPARTGRLAVARAYLHMLDALAADEDELFDAISLFEEIGDYAGAARAWAALVTLNCGRSDRLQGNEAGERMLECARRAGSKPLIGEAMRSIGSTIALGGAPVGEGIARVRALIAEAGDAVTRARLMNCLATLEAKRGRFDDARTLLAEARAVLSPAELAQVEDYLVFNGAHIETMAGNMHRAEELARQGCRDYESRGWVRYLSSEMMFLVDALIAQGRLEEASTYLEQARPYAAPDDVDAQYRQARSRARLELARGNFDAAEASARTSITFAQRDEVADEHAQCLLVLAEVLRATAREDEARNVTADALRLAEERGHEVLAQHARELLGEPRYAEAGDLAPRGSSRRIAAPRT